MTHEMIGHLVRKDWFFQRWVIAFYFALGLAGLLTIRLVGGGGGFYVGATLLIASLIGVGIHLIMATVVLERSANNLPFVLSLPVSAMQHTVAKIVANLSAFLLPWLGLLAASLWLIQANEGIPDGLVPFTVIVLTEIAAAYCIMLAVALVSESEAWAIIAIVVLNLGFNFFLYAVSHLPGIAEHMEGSVAVWNRTAITVLAAEAIAIAITLTITFALQARKRDVL